jgi:hypothetical protein
MIENIEIISPKEFPPFILELTKIDHTNIDDLKKFLKMSSWLGKTFNVVYTGIPEGKLLNYMQAVYCIIHPDKSSEFLIGSDVNIKGKDSSVIPSQSGDSFQIYSGFLLFDIPADPTESLVYFCLVLKTPNDPKVNIPALPYDATAGTDYYLTGNKNATTGKVAFNWKTLPAATK